MSKKILTALAPVAAIVAFMAIPAFAQATTQIQKGGVEIANGAAVVGQTTNLTTQTHTGAEAKPTLTCEHIEFKGTVTKNQSVAGPPVQHAAGQISENLFKGCKSDGLTTHITTNVPWVLQVQEPDAAGNFVTHILPDPGKNTFIQFSAQVQLLGFSAATCDYSASSIQGNGTKGSNVVTVTGTDQFTLQSGSSACGANGTLEGTITLTSGGSAVTVDKV